MKIERLKRLSSEEIEERSAELLLHFAQDYFTVPKATPIFEISQFLTREHKIVFDFTSTLGFTDEGFRLVGAFNPKKRVILIDSSLAQDENKFNFTLAHELGHLALHRKLNVKYDYKSNQVEVDESINEKVVSAKALKTDLEWMEWQANSYASSLLMPKEIFKLVLFNTQRQIGISKSGKIFIDDQKCNQVDFYRVINLLSTFFKVSKSAVEFRLQKLQLVDDQRTQPIAMKDIISKYTQF
jgi:Zn-dependent peptidase ImmA (M78 family)